MATICRSPPAVRRGRGSSPSPSVAHHHQVVDRRLPAPRPRSQLTIDAARRSVVGSPATSRAGAAAVALERDRLDAVITGLLFTGMRRSEVSSTRYAARVASWSPAAVEPGVEAAERAGADAPSAPEAEVLRAFTRRSAEAVAA